MEMDPRLATLLSVKKFMPKLLSPLTYDDPDQNKSTAEQCFTTEFKKYEALIKADKSNSQNAKGATKALELIKSWDQLDTILKNECIRLWTVNRK